MADNDQHPAFQIQRFYLKDLSLEQPNSPTIFLDQTLPTIDVGLSFDNEKLAEDIYETCVTVTVTAKVGDKTAYLVEGKQAGIFELRNIPEKDLEPLLAIRCPNLVYPYLRANIADIISRAGFTPVHLAEINFEMFYREGKQDEEIQLPRD